jgi:glutamine amidotransferase-like uncharacterized protein
MRIPLVGLALFVLLLSAAAADELVLSDGTRLQGTVESVVLEGRGTLARDQVLAVHLSDDRAFVDAAWIERLLRFALDRARRGIKAGGDIGVYVGRGVSAPSAIAIVRTLDARKRAPRLLFETDVTKEGLRGLATLVMPGGWAPSQLAGLGAEGQAQLKTFVLRGGRYLGICAGGYLPCTDIVWAGERITYPVRLVDGTASGPVPGRAPWPKSEAFKLELAGGRSARALYAGGSSFTVRGAEVLATYPGGAAAAVRVKSGKGYLLLTGAHVEFDERRDVDLLEIGAWAKGVKPGDGKLLEAFLKLLAK